MEDNVDKCEKRIVYEHCSDESGILKSCVEMETCATILHKIYLFPAVWLLSVAIEN